MTTASASSTHWSNRLGHVGYGVAAAAIVLMGITFFEATQKAEASAASIDGTLEVLRVMAHISEGVSQTEAAHRSYLTTGGVQYLAERDRANARFPVGIALLEEATLDRAEVAAAVPRIQELIVQHIALMDRQASEWARRGRPGEPPDTAAVEQLGSKIYAQIEELEHLKLDSLKLRRTQERAFERTTTWIVSITILACMLVLVPTYIGFVRQGRARQRNERALHESRDAAERASRAKSTFLATMSHEIRTPMNGVLGMLELLALGHLDPGQRTALEIVRESGRSLLRIIDDILDFSKVEAGKLALVPEAASIATAVDGVFGIYAPNASSKGLVLKRFVDPAISPAVLVDPIRLRQVLGNLVSNAIKFTSAGHVEIRADLAGQIGETDTVRFSVRDTGMGISSEDQQRLFEPFMQAGGDSPRRSEGTGLGLSICRRLCDLMGGSIEMHSDVGRGTTVVFTVALRRADSAALKDNAAAESKEALAKHLASCRSAPATAEAESQGCLVLVVDDHPINRLVMMRQLAQLGYATESAENGAEALEKWKSRRFGLVLTDCNMPEMDGYALARGIREHEAAGGARRVPIVACTANALAGEADNCFAAGMDDYVAKPVEMMQLQKKMGQWLPIRAAAPGGNPAAVTGDREPAGAGAR